MLLYATWGGGRQQALSQIISTHFCEGPGRIIGENSRHKPNGKAIFSCLYIAVFKSHVFRFHGDVNESIHKENF